MGNTPMIGISLSNINFLVQCLGHILLLVQFNFYFLGLIVYHFKVWQCCWLSALNLFIVTKYGLCKNENMELEYLSILDRIFFYWIDVSCVIETLLMGKNYDYRQTWLSLTMVCNFISTVALLTVIGTDTCPKLWYKHHIIKVQVNYNNCMILAEITVTTTWLKYYNEATHVYLKTIMIYMYMSSLTFQLSNLFHILSIGCVYQWYIHL